MAALRVVGKQAVMSSSEIDDIVLEVISENFPKLPRVDFAEVVAIGIEIAFQFMRNQTKDISHGDLKSHMSSELSPENITLP